MTVSADDGQHEGLRLGLVLPDLGAGRLQPEDPGLETTARHDGYLACSGGRTGLLGKRAELKTQTLERRKQINSETATTVAEQPEVYFKNRIDLSHSG